MTDSTAKPPFQFPQFNMPGFPYASLPQQLAAAFVPPDQQFSNGSQYGRWNGVNNNAFGLFPNQFQSLFGSPTPPPGMQFQPPWANNGYLGSNQGPGANPGTSPPAMPPQQPPQPPMPTGDPSLPPPGPLPGAVAGPGGTYPMPTNPQFIDPNKQPVGGVTPNAPNYFMNPNAINSVGPAGFTPPGSNVTPLPPPSSVTPLGGGAINKTPLDGNNKMAGGPGLLGMPNAQQMLALAQQDKTAGGSGGWGTNPNAPINTNTFSQADDNFLYHWLGTGGGAANSFLTPLLGGNVNNAINSANMAGGPYNAAGYSGPLRAAYHAYMQQQPQNSYQFGNRMMTFDPATMQYRDSGQTVMPGGSTQRRGG